MAVVAGRRGVCAGLHIGFRVGFRRVRRGGQLGGLRHEQSPDRIVHRPAVRAGVHLLHERALAEQMPERPFGAGDGQGAGIVAHAVRCDGAGDGHSRGVILARTALHPFHLGFGIPLRFVITGMISSLRFSAALGTTVQYALRTRCNKACFLSMQTPAILVCRAPLPAVAFLRSIGRASKNLQRFLLEFLLTM